MTVARDWGANCTGPCEATRGSTVYRANLLGDGAGSVVPNADKAGPDSRHHPLRYDDS